MQKITHVFNDSLSETYSLHHNLQKQALAKYTSVILIAHQTNFTCRDKVVQGQYRNNMVLICCGVLGWNSILTLNPYSE